MDSLEVLKINPKAPQNESRHFLRDSTHNIGRLMSASQYQRILLDLEAQEEMLVCKKGLYWKVHVDIVSNHHLPPVLI